MEGFQQKKKWNQERIWQALNNKESLWIGIQNKVLQCFYIIKIVLIEKLYLINC